MSGGHDDVFEDISCECADQDSKPVDYLGDNVCSERVATKVKKMIEKFDTAKKESNGNILQETKSDIRKPSLKTASTNSVKALSASYERLPHIQPTKSFYKMNERKKSTHLEKPKVSLESGGFSYQSRTTIAKTSNGVRITTDIFYDPIQANSVEEGIGSRIETDIPPSRILQDFQQKFSDLD